MKNSIIIGIAGGSASGKTSISRRVYEFFKGSHTTCIIKQDDYYKDQSHLSFEERVKTNYDHPFAFDNDLLVEQLKQLKEGKSISKPTYDYTMHTRSVLMLYAVFFRIHFADMRLHHFAFLPILFSAAEQTFLHRHPNLEQNSE